MIWTLVGATDSWCDLEDALKTPLVSPRNFHIPPCSELLSWRRGLELRTGQSSACHPPVIFHIPLVAVTAHGNNSSSGKSVARK